MCITMQLATRFILNSSNQGSIIRLGFFTHFTEKLKTYLNGEEKQELILKKSHNYRKHLWGKQGREEIVQMHW